MSSTLFTSRELEILGHIAEGKMNKEIAAELFLSVETIKSHVRHILQKTGEPTRSSAVAFALRRGYIQ